MENEIGLSEIGILLGFTEEELKSRLSPHDDLQLARKSIDSKQDKGLRHNKGKIRFDLLEPFAIEELAKVFTRGAEKYEDNNWLKGMKWSKMRASLGRHLAAYDKGEDFDFDPTCNDCKSGTCTNHTNLYHISQVAWNALAILSYYKHYPQGDDRYIRPIPRVGYDIDDVVCNWIEPWCKEFNMPVPSNWSFQWNIEDEFKRLEKEGKLDEFYLNLPPREGTLAMAIDPVCYISHRPVDKCITEEWLDKNGFPLKPVFHVKNREDKVKVALEQKLDIFVDDNFETFRAMNDAGISCFLMDTKHNQRHNVGYKRIKSLKELL